MCPLLRPVQALLVVLVAVHGCNLFHSSKTPPRSEVVVAEGPRIGELAPEIEGEDVDGARFRLSDYRGKVVVLDFWGNW